MLLETFASEMGISNAGSASPSSVSVSDSHSAPPASVDAVLVEAEAAGGGARVADEYDGGAASGWPGRAGSGGGGSFRGVPAGELVRVRCCSRQIESVTFPENKTVSSPGSTCASVACGTLTSGVRVCCISCKHFLTSKVKIEREDEGQVCRRSLRRLHRLTGATRKADVRVTTTGRPRLQRRARPLSPPSRRRGPRCRRRRHLLRLFLGPLHPLPRALKGRPFELDIGRERRAPQLGDVRLVVRFLLVRRRRAENRACARGRVVPQVREARRVRALDERDECAR